jgi:hypothetical protein
MLIDPLWETGHSSRPSLVEGNDWWSGKPSQEAIMCQIPRVLRAELFSRVDLSHDCHFFLDD